MLLQTQESSKILKDCLQIPTADMVFLTREEYLLPQRKGKTKFLRLDAGKSTDNKDGEGATPKPQEGVGMHAQSGRPSVSLLQEARRACGSCTSPESWWTKEGEQLHYLGGPSDQLMLPSEPAQPSIKRQDISEMPDTLTD